MTDRYDDNGILIESAPAPAAPQGQESQAPVSNPAGDAHEAAHKNPMFQRPEAPAPAQEPTPTPTAPVAEEPAFQAPPVVPVQVQADGIVGEVAKLLANNGVENTTQIVNELHENGGSLSLTTQAQLTKDLGPELTNLVVSQLNADIQSRQAASTAAKDQLLDYTHKVFGGKHDAQTTWNDLQDYVQSGAAGLSATDIAGLNEVIASGGLGAQYAIDKLYSIYKNSDLYEQPADPVNGASGATANFTPISKMDYVAELDSTIEKYGYESQQVRALNARRTRSAQMGW